MTKKVARFVWDWRHTTAYLILIVAVAVALYALQARADDRNHRDVHRAEARQEYLCEQVEQIRQNQLQVYAALIAIRTSIAADPTLSVMLRHDARESLTELRKGRQRVLALSCRVEGEK